YYYTDDGLPKKSIHTGKNSYPDYQLQWQYDSNRRLTSVTDISGNKTIPRYDSLGRIAATDFQSVKGNFETLSAVAYDQFSRVRRLHYGSGMKRIIKYDQWGDQKDVTDRLSGKLINHWSFDYDLENNITVLQQQTGQGEQALLHYRYDTLNNLTTMTCTGSAGLPLCPRDTAFSGSGFRQAPIIVRQDYSFTSLNRIDQVKEILQNNEKQQTAVKTMYYRYTDPSVPLRLQGVSTVWDQNTPVFQQLYYDQTGNMIIDGEGNHIAYNAFNQITRVIKTTGRRSYYTYDGSGKETMEKNDTHTDYLFYRGGSLINEKIITSANDFHITGYQGVAKVTDGIINEYYESSYKGDIVSILSKADNGNYSVRQTNLYSPYGMVWHKNKTSHELYKQSLQEFDGERTDPFTGWQFLGAGHRTYNPKQRYFVSEDPAGDGYAFGNNNPVMNTDPSGNMPHWLGNTLQWAGYISTFGLGALHKKWANIAAAVIGFGLCVATLGASVLTGGSTAISTVLAGSALVSTLPIASAAVPANKGLGIAASVIGLADLAVNIASGAALAFLGVAAEENLEETVVEMKAVLRPKFTYQMLKASALATSDNWVNLPPDVIPGTIGSELKNYLIKNNLSDFINKKDGLIIKNAYRITVIWEWLIKSKFESLILCDTVTIILTARINYQPLSLNLFSTFIGSCYEVVSKNCDMFIYYKSLDEILNSLSDGIHTVKWEQPKNPYTLSRMVPVGEYIVIAGGDSTGKFKHPHIGVLQRLDNAWRSYSLDKAGNGLLETNNLDILYRKYFWSYSNNWPEIHCTLKLRDRFTDDIITYNLDK
ncbi:MAG: RHS repeat-associated core domain-containing protein, partial [Endozoicomonadaceae bacterium]|nr:RHS repeat-associated core domain-containing protein [Endozoicomonadaceae bacterium]